MRIGNPLPVSLPQESAKATRIIKSFVNSNNGVEGLIPTNVLKSAYGFAIFTIAKAGFLMSVRAGSGVVVARLPDGKWSAPSAIGTGGMGIGGQVGAEVAEFILVLNSKSAVTQFMSAGSLTLGGNLSIALGPVGRNAEGSGALNSKGKVAAMYSYSKTKGAFAGISVEGSAIFERQDCNVKAYGNNATATKLLSGHFDIPPWAEDLVRVLTVCAGSYTEYVNRDLPLQFPRKSSFESEIKKKSNNSFAIENSNSIFPNKKLSIQEPFSSHPLTNEPYTFSSPYASISSTPKSQNKKGIFTVGSWKLNSRQNSTKSEQSTPSRQNTPAPHWIENIRSQSPQSTQDRFNASALYNFGHPARFASQDENSYGHKKEDSATDDEIRSLSSIGSGDEDHCSRLQNWRISNQQDQNHLTGTGIELNKSEPHRRNWIDSVHTTHHVVDKNNMLQDEEKVQGGIIDDLISFDQITRHSPSDSFSKSINSIDSQTFGMNNLSIIQSNNNYSNNKILNPINKKKSKSFDKNFKQIDKENDLFDHSIHFEDKDFLVATRLPSVFKTQTELSGLLGKVVAKYDFISDQPGDLNFKKGDLILIVDKIDDQWWSGSIGLRRGIFPVNRVSNYTQ